MVQRNFFQPPANQDEIPPATSLQNESSLVQGTGAALQGLGHSSFLVCACVYVGKEPCQNQQGYLGAHFMQGLGNGLGRHIAVEDVALQHTRVLVTGHESKIPARRGEPSKQGQGSRHWSLLQKEEGALPVPWVKHSM